MVRQSARYTQEIFLGAAPAVERLLRLTLDATPAQKRALVKLSKEFYTKKRYRKLITQNTQLWQALTLKLGEAKTEPMIEFLLHNGSSRIWQRSDNPANPDELLFTLTYYASTILIAKTLLVDSWPDTSYKPRLAIAPLRKVFGKSAVKLPKTNP